MTWLLREVRSAVVSSAFLAFSRAFTELGAALIVGGNIRGATRTLTTYVALDTIVATTRGRLRLV